ncbi:uncharacterized protein LOC143212643 [Lasioglossum baleicum]|uniref:uncharacterized protein LOC143212643 n=1 Tax=Lasioglossum baleicum TaxID=434251 RepID=UPI003FCD4649
MKIIFENMQHDCDVLVNPNEVKIFFKYIDKSRRIVYMFLGMSIIKILSTLVLILIPTILHFNYQLRFIQLLGFFYTEYDTRSNLVCLHLTLTTVLGVLSVSCTEASLAVISFYMSGLFEIVGYVQNNMHQLFKYIREFNLINISDDCISSCLI